MYMNIELTRGMYAIVDDDFDSSESWYYGKNGYAMKRLSGSGNKKEYLHHRVLPKKSGYDVDHINKNKLDNRKCNLRYLTHQENCFNIGKSKAGRSKYKGVAYHGDKTGKWTAQVTINGKKVYLGLFKTEEEAALCYNDKVQDLFGSLSYKNTL